MLLNQGPCSLSMGTIFVLGDNRFLYVSNCVTKFFNIASKSRILGDICYHLSCFAVVPLPVVVPAMWLFSQVVLKKGRSSDFDWPQMQIAC